MSFETVAGTACLDLPNKGETLEITNIKAAKLFLMEVYICSTCLYFMTKLPLFSPVREVLYVILERGLGKARRECIGILRIYSVKNTWPQEQDFLLGLLY
jgi:hypothetical protein